jgi:hypothetical protein
MRAVIPAIAILVVVLFIVGFGLLFIETVRTFRDTRAARTGPGWGERAWNAASGWLARREARARSRAPWTPYCDTDPETGNYLIGIKKIHRGEVVHRVHIHEVPADDPGACLEWQITANVRAGQCNLGLPEREV